MIRPLNGRIIAERLPEETTKGALILAVSEKPDHLKVLVVSEDSPVNEGDVVVIEKYTGQQLMLEDKEYVIVKNENIIAVLS